MKEAEGLMGTIENPYPEQEVDQFGLPYWRVNSWEELRSILKKCGVEHISIGSVTFSPNGDMELELHDNKVWGIKTVVEEAEG